MLGEIDDAFDDFLASISRNPVLLLETTYEGVDERLQISSVGINLTTTTFQAPNEVIANGIELQLSAPYCQFSLATLPSARHALPTNLSLHQPQASRRNLKLQYKPSKTTASTMDMANSFVRSSSASGQR